MTTLDYTVTTPKNVDEAVAAIESKSEEKGFSVFHIHDVSTTLEGKRVPREA